MSLTPLRLVTPLSPMCKHCGDIVPAARAVDLNERVAKFCCDGCSSVYSFLQELRLDREYYSLRGEKRPPFKPRVQSDEDYSSLDLPPFRENSSIASHLDFFLEGIHCTACVWILERLPEMGEGILSARLDIGRSILSVNIGAEGRFETVAKILLALGYRPHPVLTEAEKEQKLQDDDHRTLRRMGVAAFAAMNVMIYSISLYSEVDGKLGVLFRVLSLLVALPALTYSAWPFYRQAFQALRARRISIDLPISMAFIFGFLESVRQTVLGSNLFYLDSLTSLVFLMLGSRYALSRLERAELSRSGLLHSLLPTQVERKLVSGEFENTRTDRLRIGDTVRLKAGMKIPADGVIQSGRGYVDLSVLTGESHPVRVEGGDRVFAGSVFTDGEVEFLVETRGYDTRLGDIEKKLEAIRAPQKSIRIIRSDRWAQIFLGVVIGLSLVLLISFGVEESNEAFKRSLSLLIIACPCALALATPLTLARAYRLAGHFGLLLRNPDVLERVRDIRRVVFDKTGTLTRGAPVLQSWSWASDIQDHEKAWYESIAYTLEENARHPYGKAIRTYLENRADVKLIHGVKVEEVVGSGVRTKMDDVQYALGRKSSVDHESLGSLVLSEDSRVLATIQIQDELRAEARQVIDSLQSRGFEIEILSGDAEISTSRISSLLGIKKYRSRLSPEEKKEYLVEVRLPTLVVGDGVNDALMLKSADIGVAFNRGDGTSIESSLTGSDVVVMNSNLMTVLALFNVADRYHQTLTRNAIFSAVYNLIGASIAVAGFIHPIVAAVAMPVSALTVFLSTQIGLRAKGVGVR